MSEEPGQTFPGGDISVATAELNPIMYQITFMTIENMYDVLNNPEIVVPPNSDSFHAHVKNNGDENIDIRVTWILDGAEQYTKDFTDISPGKTQEIEPTYPVPPAYIAIGEHSFSWELRAKRTTDVSYPTTPQVSDSVTYYVYTEELNPELVAVSILFGFPDYYTIISNDTPVPNVVIDAGVPLTQGVDIHTRNNGDEPIKTRVTYTGVPFPTGKTDENVLQPGAELTSGIGGAGHIFTAGKHSYTAEMWACRTTETFPATPQISVSGEFYAYTPSLDAIATTVSIVQGTTEHTWLTDDGAGGFTVSVVTIEPDVATTFKFEMSNSGDEPVKLNVGHYVVDHYETGFLIDSTLLDTVEKDVIVDAGATSIINTVSFTPLANFTVDAFAVLRARHLI